MGISHLARKMYICYNALWDARLLNMLEMSPNTPDLSSLSIACILLSFVACVLNMVLPVPHFYYRLVGLVEI